MEQKRTGGSRHSRRAGLLGLLLGLGLLYSCGGGGGGGGAGDKRLMPPGALAERRLVFRVRSPEPHAKRLTRDFRRLLYECHTRTAIYL